MADRPAPGVGPATAPGALAGSALRVLLLDVLGCALDGRAALYVSAPITTGRRFLDWRRGPGRALAEGSDAYAAEHWRHVVEPNVAHVVPLVRRLRRDRVEPVIDPTVLADVPGWSQRDYHELWTGVVERYARAVVFVDGWQYSVGGTLEYLAALRSGAEALSEDLTPLRPAQASALVAGALAEIADGVLPATPLLAAREQLERAIAAQGRG